METNNRKLRLSYTLLSLWDRGDIDGAIRTYFHMTRPITPQMEDGKRIHEEIAEHIQNFNTFPDWFFNHELKIPECEKIVQVEYNDLFDLKGLFDCYDTVTEVLYEFKTGVADSLEWTRTWQLPLYFLLAEIAKIPVKYALLIHYNQYKKTTDYTIMHNTKLQRDYARNIVDSIGPDIHNYFTDKGLLGQNLLSKLTLEEK